MFICTNNEYTLQIIFILITFGTRVAVGTNISVVLGIWMVFAGIYRYIRHSSESQYPYPYLQVYSYLFQALHSQLELRQRSKSHRMDGGRGGRQLGVE